MNVKVITIYTVPNYGSVLQAFATQTILESLGHKVELINYDQLRNDWQLRHRRRGTKERLKSVVKKILGKHLSRQERNLLAFRKEFFHETPSFRTYKALANYDWSNTDVIIVGSDQVWNTRFSYGNPVYMLAFVPETTKRVAIASSFASKSLPKEYRETFRKHLSKFHAISVREENSAKIIAKELGLQRPLVSLDPTLLLNKAQWMETLKTNDHTDRKPYILLYMLTYAFEPRPYIFEVLKHFKEKLGCDIIALTDNPPKEKTTGVEITTLESPSVREFFNLFAGARLVVTSSFHGTVFALINQVPLVSVVPSGNGDDRQRTLLRNLGVEQCAVEVGTPIEQVNPYYDVNSMESNLRALREESINWIAQNV